MAINAIRGLVTATIAAALLAGATLAHEGDNPYGSWRSSGVDSFSQGWLQNLKIDGDSEELVLDKTVQGFFRPSGSFTSPFHEVPVEYDAFQVGFDADLPGDSELTVQVRAIDVDGGDKTRWYSVDVEDDVVLPQKYKFFQYRVRLTTHDPTESPRFKFFAATFTSVKDPGIGEIEGSGNGSVAKPEVWSRNRWGARPPKKSYTNHDPKILVIHHTAIPDQDQYQGATTVRGIQGFHQNGRGWIDIGYHFLIGPEGIIYQGRPETVRGAHATPNTDKVGICLIGDYQDNDELKPETRQALVDLLAWLAATYEIDPQSKITGHRDWNDTNCPGIDVYEELPQIRNDVQAVIDSSTGDGAGTGAGESIEEDGWLR